MAVKDWRNIVRVANVDMSALTKDASAGADLIDLMVQAVEQINAPEAVKLAFYVPRTVRSFLRRQITNK
ncbi:phage major capsid protein, partial [Klebsiella pneumoniae]|uniref:phage major capsid protein n=1 Tax=Klebsiella pneumoniae TaxID=573 RepID=UPI003F1F59FD